MGRLSPSVAGATECPACQHPWDEACLSWMKRRHGHYFCPFCLTSYADRVPDNYFATAFDTPFEAPRQVA